MNRLRLGWLALGALALAGCEQMRPPTPEGLKLIKARTATGTKNTKLEAKSQPSPPRAGQVSIWDFKVFNKQDKPGGLRDEWKFFNALPQSSTQHSTTGVLMNAWLISQDRSVFLSQKPVYKQFGSFLTDWTIPFGGPYTLWVEYQPVVAKDELSGDDLKGSKPLPVEHARWDFSVSGPAPTRKLLPDSNAGKGWTVYSLDASDYGTPAPFSVVVAAPSLRVGQKTKLACKITSTSGTVSDAALTMLSPDGQLLVHEVGETPSVALSQKGIWHAWFSFSLDDKPFAAPLDLNVS